MPCLIRFRPRDQRYAPLFQYWLRSYAHWKLTRERGAFAVRPSLNTKFLNEFPIVIRPNALLDTFGYGVQKLRSRVARNTAGPSALAARRDAPLPRLIAGELHVNGALEGDRR